MQQWLKGIIHRPVTVAMITIAAVTFGVLALGRLPIELLPDITYPTLTVQTELPDASPHEVEQLVTDPVEEVVGVTQGLRRYVSNSRAGVSEVILRSNSICTRKAMPIRSSSPSGCANVSKR